MKVEVGQKVWVKRIGNEATRLRYKKDSTIDDYINEAVVTSVGRKFFTLKGAEVFLNRSKFFIDGGLDDRKGYISGFKAYSSKQEIYDEEEAENLYKEIRETWFRIGSANISLGQLKAIKSILDGPE